MEHGICNNCGTPVTGTYCSECGQRSSVHRVTFRETFQDLSAAFFELEAPFWKTFFGLIREPGKVIHKYLDGGRKSYYKPVAFFLVWTFIYFVIRAAAGFDGSALGFVKVSGEGGIPTVWGEGRQYLIAHLDKMLFTFVATLGLAMKLFFPKPFRLPEYLAISFYVVAIYTAFLSLEVVAITLLGSQAQILSYLAGILYYIYLAKAVFTGQSIWIVVRAFFSFSSALFSYMVVSYFLSVFIVWLF